MNDPLERIAAALERLAPPPAPAADWLSAPAYEWRQHARPVAAIAAPALALLRGIEAQKAAITANVERLARGHAAHDMLLWGARGMGKSAVLRSAVKAAQQADASRIALVQVDGAAVSGLAGLLSALEKIPRNFLVFIDDLGFADDDSAGPRMLRSWLEGGVQARPGNVRLAVTANRRAIVPRHLAEQDDPLNPRDAIDDQLALADRFGLAIGFHACSQDDYLAIVAGYCTAQNLPFDPAAALEWSKRRGARSGRIAWQFVTELAGLAGRSL